VLEAAEQAFGAASNCGVAERLLRALEAAGAEGRGDVRCTRDGGPALAATLSLDPREGTPLRLAVEVPPGEDPAALLRVMLEERARDACEPPVAVGGAGGGGGEGGAPEAQEAAGPGCAVAPRVPGGTPRASQLLGLGLALAARRFRRLRARRLGRPRDEP
jgi:hypothetical protein